MLSGVRLVYLPPYSPDLNLIEEAFSKVKHWLRRHNDYYWATEGDGVLYDMWEVLDIITPDNAEGYFFHVGYFWCKHIKYVVHVGTVQCEMNAAQSQE
jgi:hypothetical protein